MELNQLAFAERIGHPADSLGQIRVADRRRQMEGVRDEVVAQHHRRLVVIQPIDRLAASSLVRFVKDVVMNQRGHVDHLEHRREPPQVI